MPIWAVQAATVANARLQSQLTAMSGQADAAKAQLANAQGQVADAQAQLAEMKRQIADLDKSVARQQGHNCRRNCRTLATLTNQARALEALRDQLEKQAQDAAATRDDGAAATSGGRGAVG